MNRIFDFGAGKRTYVAVALIFILGGLKALGVVDSATFDSVEAFIIGLGLFGLRRAK